MDSSGLLTRKEGTGVDGGEGIPASGARDVITGTGDVMQAGGLEYDVIRTGDDIGEKEAGVVKGLSRGSCFI